MPLRAGRKFGDKWDGKVFKGLFGEKIWRRGYLASFRAGFSHLNLETFMPAQNLRASLSRRAFLNLARFYQILLLNLMTV